ncbi:HK97 family phage prohead protease [Bacteroides sedimenti]|uniref:Peptidase U35 n=1 Tax=Bacteroides sedimenti TaxID=2136147 RepID=A0ABN6Z0H9_9BACE
MEIRSFDGLAAPKIVDGRTVEGYALVYNQRSKIMYDEKERRVFHEIISDKVASPELLERSDVKALIEHNRERLLARYNKGVGTLSLEFDDHGLKYRFEAPNTPDGDFALEMIQRGDISGSSFAFRSYKPGSYSWTKEANGIWLRTVNKLDSLHDVTITADPAYSGTEVTVRSITELDEEEHKEDDSYKEELQRLRSLI